MKKIYYLEKNEVKLRDIIEYNGIKALVTEELIELNPELFKIEDDTEPMYFRCLENGIDFTKDRIYIQNNHSTYPTRLILRADDNILYSIPDWNKSSLYKSYNLFELTTKEEWDKQELLDEAKRRYPIGTVYKHFNSKYTINSPDMLTVSEMDHHFEGVISISIWVRSEEYNGIVYENGEWAEILPLKFTTEDGVDIYGDMKTYLVNPYDSDITPCHGIWEGNSKAKCDKYFYHKENALAYVEKHKEKTLEDYENMLLTINIDSINARETCWFYRTLKVKEPKLYYTKILQLIADDLNDGRYIHIRGNTSYHLNNTRSMNIHCGDDEGCVYFKSRESAVKARVILGDKVKYLFK